MTEAPTQIELKRIVQRAPKEKGWKLTEHSFSKLWVVLPDGSTDIRYSMDWRGAFSSLRDQRLGIERFKAFLQTPRVRNYSLAIIYDRETNAKLLIYRDGIKTGGIL